MAEYKDGNQTVQRLINLVTRAVWSIKKDDNEIKYPLAFAPEHHHEESGAWSYYDIGQQSRDYRSRRFSFKGDDIDSSITLHIFEYPEKQGDLINDILKIDKIVYDGFDDVKGFTHSLNYQIMHDESGVLHAVLQIKN